MPLSVSYRESDKMLGVDPLAELLFVRSLAFSKEKFSDGFISNRQVMILTEGLFEMYGMTPDDLFSQLEMVGLWHRVDGGFLIEGWADWNELDASRAGTLGNHKRWHLGRGLVEEKCIHCQTEQEHRPESGATSPPIAISTDQCSTKQTPSPPAQGYTDEFLAWWAEYPQKAAKAATARKFVQARKSASLEAINEGTERWKARWKADNTELKHIPYGSSFLNQRRWEDEFEPPVDTEDAALERLRQANSA